MGHFLASIFNNASVSQTVSIIEMPRRISPTILSNTFARALHPTKGTTMFWPFIAAASVGTAFYKLGALSVWVSVLTHVIQALIIALLALAGFAIWQRYRRSKDM
jgi:hypothetical protein